MKSTLSKYYIISDLNSYYKYIFTGWCTPKLYFVWFFDSWTTFIVGLEFSTAIKPNRFVENICSWTDDPKMTVTKRPCHVSQVVGIVVLANTFTFFVETHGQPLIKIKHKLDTFTCTIAISALNFSSDRLSDAKPLWVNFRFIAVFVIITVNYVAFCEILAVLASNNWKIDLVVKEIHRQICVLF